MRCRKVVAVAALALFAASCGTSGKLAIKPLPSALAEGRHPVSFRVAEALGQFALGNVALALESYRKALRDEPASIDALTGVAACYDAMGRYDMSRRYYEEALALAPADTRLLRMLAASLLQQGRAEEAAAVRREAAARIALVAAGSAATVSASPSALVASSSINLPPPLPLPVARLSGETTVQLPVARPLPLPLPLAIAASAKDARGTPHLERLSLGEVALVTVPTPVRQSTVYARTFGASPTRAAATTTPARSLARAKAVPAPLLVLNAARSQGLAGRARRYLSSRGFAQAFVGDAPKVRARTVIIAPASERARAVKLARSFAVAPLIIEGRRLTVVLGRDAMSQPALRV